MNASLTKDKDGKAVLSIRSQCQRPDEELMLALMPKPPDRIAVRQVSDKPFVLEFYVEPGEDLSKPARDEEIDRNLRTLSLEDLQTRCAQRGIKYGEGDTKVHLIRLLQSVKVETKGD